MSNPFDQFDNPTLDRVMPRLIKQESGGRAGVVGPETPYGRAIGRTQMLPDTAKGVAEKLGVPYREDLLTGTTPEAAQYQDMLGRAYLEEGYQNTGSVDGALKYYHGGPNRDLWGPKTQAYAQAVGGQANPFDQFDAPAAQPASTPAPLAAMPAPAKPQSRAAPPPQVDQGLGFLAGVRKPLDNLVRASLSVPAIRAIDNAMSGVMGMPNAQQALQNVETDLAARKAAGVVPGKIGEFAGNVVGTLPTALLPGGVIAQGAAGGALLTDKRDFGGVAQDAVIGGLAGKVADKAVTGLKSVASNALGKAPKIMNLPELEQAYKAAYQKVDQSGFRFSKTNAGDLANDIMKYVKDRGGADLYPDAVRMASRLKSLASQKGGLPISQLDDFRSQVYDVLVKPGGKEAGLGGVMRQKIDGLISKAAQSNADIRQARDLYTRFSKMRTVTNKLDAAELQAGSAYTGKNVNNNIRQKVRPLVDPTSPQRFKNATKDEEAALRRIVQGTPAQNAVRTVGTLLDPRGLLGMGLQLTGAANTAGLTAASIPLGMAATAAGNRLSQKNVENLLRLIAAGGSTQALNKAPTAASQSAGRMLEAVRPGAPALAVAAIPRKKDRK